MVNTLFPYKWNIADGYPAKEIAKNNETVFSCFACGGGSTMGYKLAGYTVLGCNEIDPKIIEVYKENHHPKYAYCEGIQQFKNRDDLPEELYNLSILDGSPPCSSFSMAGAREKDWGKEKKFKEGQSKQVLDTLFFDFIDLAKKLQPKVVVAENVEGLMFGAAREYVKKILKEFDEAGYYIHYFLLDASTMDVPQKRKRVFFVGLRKDLAEPLLKQVDLFTQYPTIDLTFKGKPIAYKYIEEFDTERPMLSKSYLEKWHGCKLGSNPKVERTGNTFGFFYKTHPDKVLPTITGGGTNTHYYIPGKLTTNELVLAGSFPLDYNFLNVDPQYLIGMSVPPVAVACIANEIYKQWLTKI